MTDGPVEPMDPELRALLRRGAPAADVPADAKARLLARLGASIAVGAAAASVVGGGAQLAAKSATVGMSASKVVGIAAIAFAVGGAVGAGAILATQRAEVRTVYVDRPVAVVASTEPSAVPSAATAISIEELPLAAVPSAKAETGAEANPLVAERQLLDVARSAYARGDHRACLAALGTHTTKYPGGMLAEEREALAVRTLVALGRTEEARVRGARFEKKYPSSLMLPVVRAALERP